MATKTTVWRAADGTHHDTEAAAELHDTQCHLAQHLRGFIPPEAVGITHFNRAVAWIASEYQRKAPADRPPVAEEYDHAD